MHLLALLLLCCCCFKCYLTHLFQCTLSLPPENIRKPYGFLIFQQVEKGCIGNIWVNGKGLNLRITHSEKSWINPIRLQSFTKDKLV